jgi:hypothetical protein
MAVVSRIELPPRRAKRSQAANTFESLRKALRTPEQASAVAVDGEIGAGTQVPPDEVLVFRPILIGDSELYSATGRAPDTAATGEGSEPEPAGISSAVSALNEWARALRRLLTAVLLRRSAFQGVVLSSRFP